MKKILTGTLLAVSLYGWGGSISDLSKKAEDLYAKKEYRQALLVYKSLRTDDPSIAAQIKYNIGNCFYRLGNMESAIVAYKDSIQRIDRLTAPSFLASVYYNLGNSYSSKSDKFAKKSDIVNQIKYLFLAKDALTDARILNKGDSDIAVNLKIISEKIKLRDIK